MRRDSILTDSSPFSLLHGWLITCLSRCSSLLIFFSFFSITSLNLSFTLLTLVVFLKNVNHVMPHPCLKSFNDLSSFKIPSSLSSYHLLLSSFVPYLTVTLNYSQFLKSVKPFHNLVLETEFLLLRRH